MAEPLLMLEAVEKAFTVRMDWRGRPRTLVRAVDGVSMAVRRGETLGLVGESGCGKSTLASIVLGLEPPSAGRVLFDGHPLTGMPEARLRPLRRRLQVVFQDPMSSLDPRMTVRATLAEPLRVAGWSPQRIDVRVREVAELVGLQAEHLPRLPHEFSGGQRQRIAIARALALEPDFVVLDEPTSALDVSVQAQVLNLLKDLQARLGLTYLFISHNIDVIRYMSDRVAVMYLGRLVEEGPVERVLTAPAHPYTRALLDAAPLLRVGARQEIRVQGEPPSPVAPPPGCRFHPRCPLAEPVCRQAEPPWAEVAPGQWSRCHFAISGGNPADADRADAAAAAEGAQPDH